MWYLNEFRNFFRMYLEYNKEYIYLVRNPDSSVSKVTQVLFLKGVGIIFLAKIFTSFMCLIMMHVRGEVLVGSSFFRYPEVTYRRWKNILPGISVQ
jgi:hypothetical protein